MCKKCNGGEDKLVWKWEKSMEWDYKKQQVIGNRIDAFNIGCVELGQQLTGVWGYLQNEDDEILGYGWISLHNDKPEISIAIDEEYQAMGHGKRILEILENEVRGRGYTSLFATINYSNVLANKIVAWAYKNGFVATNFTIPVSVKIAAKVVEEKHQDLNLVKEL